MSPKLLKASCGCLKNFL